MSDALVVDDVHKRYGDREAVKGISFTVGEGEIFGLIGPNGAGKTTTLRMISTLLTISSGTISVCGHDVSKEPDAIREIICYLPEDAGAYKDMTGRRYLSFMAGFFKSGKEKEEMVENAIKSGRIGEDAKESWVSMAQANFELAEKTLNSIPAREKLSDVINNDPKNVENSQKGTLAEVQAKIEAVVGKDFAYHKFE